MLIERSGNQYNIDTKIITGVGIIAVVLMIYFAINMYQMVAHVGKLADSTVIMTKQMIKMENNIGNINTNTKSMSQDTHKMSSSMTSMTRGIKNVTSPRGVMNMWRR